MRLFYENFAGTLGQTRVGRFMSKREMRKLVLLFELNKIQEPFSKCINPLFTSEGMAQPMVHLNSLPGSHPAVLPKIAPNRPQIGCMHASPDHNLIANYHILAARSKPIRLYHASVAGIRDIFDNEMYIAIRKVRVMAQGGEMSEKASVSMSIPGYTGASEDVPCSMTLDIQQSRANDVLMELFEITKKDESIPDPTYIV